MENHNVKRIYSNFKRNNKWLGIIDYKSICIVLVYIFVLIKILTILKVNIELGFSIFCFCIVPIIAFILITNKEENAFEILLFVIKYIIGRKIYVKDKFYMKFNTEIYKINIVNCKKK